MPLRCRGLVDLLASLRLQSAEKTLGIASRRLQSAVGNVPPQVWLRTYPYSSVPIRTARPLRRSDVGGTEYSVNMIGKT